MGQTQRMWMSCAHVRMYGMGGWVRIISVIRREYPTQPRQYLLIDRALATHPHARCSAPSYLVHEVVVVGTVEGELFVSVGVVGGSVAGVQSARPLAGWSLGRGERAGGGRHTTEMHPPAAPNQLCPPPNRFLNANSPYLLIEVEQPRQQTTSLLGCHSCS